jgi:hypothetical protein
LLGFSIPCSHETMKVFCWFFHSTQPLNFYFLFFETRSCYVAQAGLKFPILLPYLPKCLDSRCASPHLTPVSWSVPNLLGPLFFCGYIIPLVI